MRLKLSFFIVISSLLILIFPNTAARAAEFVYSPDRKLSVAFSIQEKYTPLLPGERLYFSLYYKEKKIVADSPLGLSIKGAPAIGSDLRLFNVQTQYIKDTVAYETNTSDTTAIEYNKIILHLQEKRPPFRFFAVECIVHNHGAAFRYIMPSPGAIPVSDISRENTMIFLDRQDTIQTMNTGSNENAAMPLGTVDRDSILALPLQVNTATGTILGIFESTGPGYRRSTLKRSGDFSNALSVNLDTLGQKMPGEMATPWRIFMPGKNPGMFAYSSLFNALYNGRTQTDSAWISHGLYADADETGSAGSMESLLDSCSGLGVKFILLDDSDATQAECSVIRSKHMLPLIRISCTETAVSSEKFISGLAKRGAGGILITCSSRPDISVLNRFLTSASVYRLIAGIQTNYSLCGLSSLHCNFVLKQPTPAPGIADTVLHNLTASLPYAAMAGDPVDLTSVVTAKQAAHASPCWNAALHTASTSMLRKIYPGSNLVKHERLLSIVKDIPPVWDETRFIEGNKGKYIIVARRHGNTWYVAGFSTSASRTSDVPLKFLGGGKQAWTADIYFDNPSVSYAEGRIVISKQADVAQTDSLPVILNPQKGYIAVIIPAK